eukprot:gb/GECG01005054.1/.p1 GENE.gb/GECG01005054.1/~~gb/GECG01005054.1/.p1  ORF type:complete len:516 (+),score=56.13 gb/GECG01005054.1/:1-1548(+)
MSETKSASSFVSDFDVQPDMFQTMSISSSSRPSLPTERKYFRTHNLAYTTQDIEGATPKVRHPSRNKPDLHRNDDIEKSHPQELHGPISHGKPDYTLTVKDIEGAECKPDRFKTTRSVNPLDPEYNIPEAEHKPPSPQSYKYFGFYCDDIEGTQSVSHYARPIRKNPLDTSDIDGTHCKRGKDSRRNWNYEVNDINNEGVWKSRRSSNPLNPVHSINGMRIRDDPRSKPTVYHRELKGDHPYFPLSTLDIEGAQADSALKNEHPGAGEAKGEIRNINYVRDIPGAYPGTYRRGPGTQRETDPNERNYVLLDGAPREREVSKPLEDYRRKLQDPRDREIEDLHRQLQELRNEQKITKLEESVDVCRHSNSAAENSKPARGEKSVSDAERTASEEMDRGGSPERGGSYRRLLNTANDRSRLNGDESFAQSPQSSPPRLAADTERTRLRSRTLAGAGGSVATAVSDTRPSPVPNIPGVEHSKRQWSTRSTTSIASTRTHRSREQSSKQEEISQVRQLP